MPCRTQLYTSHQNSYLSSKKGREFGKRGLTSKGTRVLDSNTKEFINSPFGRGFEGSRQPGGGGEGNFESSSSSSSSSSSDESSSFVFRLRVGLVEVGDFEGGKLELE